VAASVARRVPAPPRSRWAWRSARCWWARGCSPARAPDSAVLAGSVLAWAIVAPALVRGGDRQRRLHRQLVGWLLWPAVGMMVTTGVLGLARAGDRSSGRSRNWASWSASQPRRLWGALAASGLAVVLLSWLVFGVHPLLGPGRGGGVADTDRRLRADRRRDRHRPARFAGTAGAAGAGRAGPGGATGERRLRLHQRGCGGPNRR
jgi:hypothetical protein